MWLFTSTGSGILAQLYLLGSRCLFRVGARTCYYIRPRAVLLVCLLRSGVNFHDDRQPTADDKWESHAASVKLHTCVHDEFRQSLPDFTQLVFPVAHVWGKEEQLAHFLCGGYVTRDAVHHLDGHCAILQTGWRCASCWKAPCHTTYREMGDSPHMNFGGISKKTWNAGRKTLLASWAATRHSSVQEKPPLRFTPAAHTCFQH